MADFTIRPKVFADNDLLAEAMLKYWHSISIITRSHRHYTLELEGFVAEQDGELWGFALYRFDNKQCELIVLQSIIDDQGVGTELINAVVNAAREHRCKRVWLITTNDNIRALRFYQKRGFFFAAIYPRAMDVSRSIEPRIPLLGHEGIPLRDEIEFEYIIEDNS